MNWITACGIRKCLHISTWRRIHRIAICCPRVTITSSCWCWTSIAITYCQIKCQHTITISCWCDSINIGAAYCICKSSCRCTPSITITYVNSSRRLKQRRTSNRNCGCSCTSTSICWNNCISSSTIRSRNCRRSNCMHIRISICYITSYWASGNLRYTFITN